MSFGFRSSRSDNPLPRGGRVAPQGAPGLLVIHSRVAPARTIRGAVPTASGQLALAPALSLGAVARRRRLLR